MGRIQKVKLARRGQHKRRRIPTNPRSSPTVVQVGGRGVPERGNHRGRISDTRHACNRTCRTTDLTLSCEIRSKGFGKSIRDRRQTARFSILLYEILPGAATCYAALALASSFVVLHASCHLQERAESLIHGFRIRKGLSNIGLEKNEVRPGLVPLVVLPSDGAVQFRKIVFVSHR